MDTKYLLSPGTPRRCPRRRRPSCGTAPGGHGPGVARPRRGGHRHWCTASRQRRSAAAPSPTAFLRPLWKYFWNNKLWNNLDLIILSRLGGCRHWDEAHKNLKSVGRWNAMVNSDSFIYLPTFILSFNSIFVETAADLTLDHATEEAKLLSVMASFQAMAIVRSFLMVVNEHLLLWWSKNQESTTRHKTQGLEAVDICHLSIFNGSDLQIF